MKHQQDKEMKIEMEKKFEKRLRRLAIVAVMVCAAVSARAQSVIMEDDYFLIHNEAGNTNVSIGDTE